MIATTRSAECNAGGTPLMLAFDLGSTEERHEQRNVRVVVGCFWAVTARVSVLASAPVAVPLGALSRSVQRVERLTDQGRASVLFFSGRLRLRDPGCPGRER